MRKNVLIYGAQDARSWDTARYFARGGSSVYAVFTWGAELKQTDGIACFDELDKALAAVEAAGGTLDLLTLTATEHTPDDHPVGMERHDYSRLLRTLDENVNGCLSAIEKCLPLLEKGQGKRIGVLTPANGSVRCGKAESDYGYLMSSAALNMAQKLYFNRLHPLGFSFRNEYAVEGAGLPAGVYMDMDLCYDKNDAYSHSDENRLVMRDAAYREIAW